MARFDLTGFEWSPARIDRLRRSTLLFTVSFVAVAVMFRVLYAGSEGALRAPAAPDRGPDPTGKERDRGAVAVKMADP
jgi:hypothetical protein